MSSLIVKLVSCEANAGAVITECIKEAFIMAMSEDRVVVFKHNEKEWKVDPHQIIAEMIGSKS